MSAIYFTSPTDEAKLRGSERSYMGHIAGDALLTALTITDSHNYMSMEEDARQGVCNLLRVPESTYRFGRTFDPKHVHTTLIVAMSEEYFLMPTGEEMPVWTTGMNTVLSTGNDAMMLTARLHGQCEIHCYVEGPNRAWLADIIEQGRSTGLYRPEQGWEGVAEMLAKDDRDPVVCSYSVCDIFPSDECAIDTQMWHPEVDDETGDWLNEEEWYNMPPERQWDLCMEGLRKTSKEGCWLELTPEHWNWPDWHFRHPINGYHVRDVIRRGTTPPPRESQLQGVLDRLKAVDSGILGS